MAAAELGPWAPMPVAGVAEVFDGLGVPWWFTGGHALEMAQGRSWRAHGDIDVGICRVDAASLISLLDDWEVHVAAAGQLRRWSGDALSERDHENNLWLRREGGPWQIDVTVGDGDRESWVYRRDRTFRLPWERALCTSSAGHDYLHPALQLLFKSTGLREKDGVDAHEVIPALGPWGTAVLDVRLRGDHPWRGLIDRHRRPLTEVDAFGLYTLLRSAGVDVWIDGGWGVDALLGEQTRAHADLDVALPTRQWAITHETLRERGFDLVRDDGPYNVVFVDGNGSVVDLHAFDDTTTIVGDDGIERHGPDGLAYESGGFTGSGRIGGNHVDCMSASFQMRSHTGYTVDDDDWHDVRHLHERFGLPIPVDYAVWEAHGSGSS